MLVTALPGEVMIALLTSWPGYRAPKMSRNEIRALFKPFTSPCDRLAACKVVVDILSYSLLLLAIIHIEIWPIKAALSIPAGMVITRLFILGHDACHGSLFSRSWANRWIGRLCFLASLTPYSLWELGHNTIHHGFTNLKGRDSIWTPLSLEEYEKAGRLTRWLQRSYRTPWGVGLYYAIELWWKKLFFPSRNHVGVRRKEHLLDNLLVSGYVGLLIGAVSLTAPSVRSALVNVFFAVILPAVLWNWIVGFTVFVHHTHPCVRWFKSRKDWSFEQGQIESTVHMRFPHWWTSALHNIYEHTAHHMDVNIPCYRLAAAQCFAEQHFGEHIVVQDFTWTFFLCTLRDCNLYDYDNHRWLRFDGTPTHSHL